MSETLKTAVIYYSSTGNNYQMAQWAAESAKNEGSEVRIRKAKELAPEWVIEQNPAWKKNADATKDVEEVSLDDLDWADVIVFSVPTRYGNVPSQIKQFMDSTGPLWQKGKLTNKVVTAMTRAMNTHGGQESTILSLYTTMYHWGAIVVTPGYTDSVLYAAGGNPYGLSVSVDGEGNMKEDRETIKKAVFYQAKRAVSVGKLIAGKNQS
ncbi:MAG: NAD(P)H:quinone oxidoreductase [Mariniphaga sp.]